MQQEMQWITSLFTPPAVCIEPGERRLHQLYWIREILRRRTVAEEDEWTVNLKANGTFINFKLDSSAQVNVLPETVLLLLGEKPRVVENELEKLRSCTVELNSNRRV